MSLRAEVPAEVTDQSLSVLDAVAVVVDLEEEVAEVEVDILDQSLVFLLDSLLHTLVVGGQVVVAGWEVGDLVLEVVLSVFSDFSLVLALTRLFLLFGFLVFTLVVLVELS